MFNAGAISAELTVDTSKFDSDMAKAQAKVKAFESARHEVKISAVFDTSSISRARQQFAQLDQQVSKDAMSRLRSSPQGSVLGALNALFSPHPVTGAPSASQAAQQGLLGKIISQPGGGGTAGPSSGTQGVVSQVLGGNTGTAQSNANQRVSTVGLPQDTTTTDRVKVVGGATDNNITTTDRVNTVGLPSNNSISTEDRVNVTGLPTSGGTIVTEDKIEPDIDEASLKAKASQAGKDAADSADDAMAKEAKSKGPGWFSGFLDGISGMIGKASSGGGGNNNSKNSSSGNSSGPLDSGLIGGIGPSVLGISTKATAIIGAVGTALAALPALAGIAGTGLGVALIGGAVAGVVATSPKLKAQFTTIGTDLKTVLTAAAGPLIPALSAVLNQVPALVKQLQAPLAGIFATIAPQIQGVFAGLIPILNGVIGVMSAAAPAFGPFIEALEKLAANIFPGIEAVVKATVPVISQFGTILGQLGTNLGGLFADAAPAIKASMQVLGDLLGVVGGLLPILTQLGDIFATALAPVFTQFGAVVKSLEPVLVLVGQVLASLAQAVVGDLVSAFGAVAKAIQAATPGLTALATGLGNVFTVMENAGVFAVLGDSLENLAGPIGTLIGTLASGLVPILTQVVTFVAQLSTVIVGQLTSAIVQLLPSITKLASTALAALAAVLPVVLPLLVQIAGVLTGALAATIVGIATALTAVITAIPPAVLGTLAVAVAAVVGGFKLWAAAMALIQGSAFAGAVVGIVDVVTAFAEATTGLSLAEKALAASSLALDAVSPFAWVALTVAPLAALTAALVLVSAQSQTIVGSFAQQEQQLNYNISGYKALTDTITNAAAGYAKFAQSSTDAVRANGAGAAALQQQLTAQAAQVSATGAAIVQRATAMSQALGVSTTVIEQWGNAAGISGPKFGSAAENVGSLTQQVIAFVNKNASAVTATASLGTNVAIFGNDVFSATTQLDAFNGIFNTLVGNLLTKQQAVTQGQQSFDNLKQSIASSGAASTQSQQSFQAYIQQIQSSLDSLQKGGASVSDLNGYLQTQIGHLESLGPLNAGEKADLANLKTFQDDLANSTNGLNTQQKTLIGQFETGLIPSLQQMGADTPKVTTAIGNLADSIIQTGNGSASTKSDRAQLIADLGQVGIHGQTATTLVNGLQKQIDALQGKVVSVGVVGSGSGTITFAEQNIKNAATGLLEFHAAGGPIGGSGGPTQDNIPVWASSGEFMMQASAVSKYGLPFMEAVNAQRLATGGAINISSILSAPDWMGNVMASAAESAEGTDASLMIADMKAKVAAAAAAAAAAASAAASAFTTSGGASGGIIQAMFASMAAARGWTGAELTALLEVESREAGFNMTATNPSSGAYGLAQFIDGPSEYAQYGGNSTTASGQITAMLSYIAQRYGDPIAAEAHEAAFGWYDKGGPLQPGYTLAYNGTGRTEQVISGKSMDDIADLLRELNGHMRQQIDVTRAVPAGVGQHVGSALNGASHDASFRARYPRN